MCSLTVPSRSDRLSLYSRCSFSSTSLPDALCHFDLVGFTSLFSSPFHLKKFLSYSHSWSLITCAAPTTGVYTAMTETSNPSSAGSGLHRDFGVMTVTSVTATRKNSMQSVDKNRNKFWHETVEQTATCKNPKRSESRMKNMMINGIKSTEPARHRERVSMWNIGRMKTLKFAGHADEEEFDTMFRQDKQMVERASN